MDEEAEMMRNPRLRDADGNEYDPETGDRRPEASVRDENAVWRDDRLPTAEDVRGILRPDVLHQPLSERLAKMLEDGDASD